MKNKKNDKYFLGIVGGLLLCGVFFLIAQAGENTRRKAANDLESIVENNLTNMADVEKVDFVSDNNELSEEWKKYSILVDEVFDYEVEEKIFSFYTDETVYSIPYVRISGCPNEYLQWKINHILWEEACWIFDCAELEDEMYNLFEGEYAMHIIGIHQYGRFLSVVYALGDIETYEWTENIVYAIVVDTLSGERVMLTDMVKDNEAFKDLLVHYFDDIPREIGLFIFEEDAEEILLYGGMTEAEIVRYNVSLKGKYPENVNGDVGSASWIFSAASFYMTEDSFVVLPGAYYFEELIFDWENVSEAIYTEEEW